MLIYLTVLWVYSCNKSICKWKPHVLNHMCNVYSCLAYKTYNTNSNQIDTKYSNGTYVYPALSVNLQYCEEHSEIGTKLNL